MSPTGKVTYISLSADDPALDAAFTSAIADVRAALGRDYPLHVAGDARAAGGAAIESRSPADTRVVVARVATATEADVRDAVAAARAAFPRWSAVPWQERAAILDRAADIVRERRFELAAWLIFEMGKNRVEALGEIEETADLYAYYAAEMRANAGYVREMGRLVPTDTNTSVLRPYGVWARHRALELPVRAARGAGRGGVGCRQHRRHEAVLRDAAVGGQAGRDLRAGRRAARRRQLPAGKRPRRRRRPAGSSRRRRG